MTAASAKPIGYRLPQAALLLLALAHEALSKQGFILTAPNRLVPGKSESICIAFSDDLSTVDVSYALRRVDSGNATGVYSEQRATFSSRAGGCTSLTLPRGVSDHAVDLAVQGNASDGYNFGGRTRLRVLSTDAEFTLIQTDKPVYKPGQTVKMRLVTLTVDLIPVLDQPYHVWIEDPSGIRVEQWLNVSAGAGITELAFKLALEPPLGEWKITCATSRRRELVTFRVDEYVLPRFEVTIKSLPLVSCSTRFITGEICARYTYGQPVKGQIDASFKLSNMYEWRQTSAVPRYPLQQEVNGCSEFNISTSDIGIGGSNDDFYFGRRLVISAAVTEYGTGVRINASDVSVNLEPHDSTIEIIVDDKYKPGFNYSGKVKVSRRDGSPFPEQLLVVSVRDERIRTVFNKQALTDSMGQVTFEIPMPADVIHEYTIEARLLSGNYTYEWQRPSASKQLSSWFSPSGSYLRLLAPSNGGNLRCGQSAQVELEYTTNASQTVLLRTQVVGISDIELSTTQELLLEPQQRIQWNMTNEIDEKVNETVEETGEVEAETYDRDRRSIIFPSRGPHGSKTASKNVRQMFRGKKTLSFQVNSRMSPAAHILVFYIRPDGEVVADAITLAVEECAPNEVSMSFSKNTVKPGEEVNLKLTAAAGSLCAVGVVDKSVYLMDSSKRPSLKQLHRRLQAYRLSQETGVHEQSGDREYCEKQLEPQSGKDTVAAREDGRTRFRPWWSGNFYYSMYKDSSHAFEAGATVTLTDLKLSTRPCVKYTPRLYALPGARSGQPIAVAMAVDSNVLDSELPESTPVKSRHSSIYKPSVEIRTYFPETWLWDTMWINPDGKAEKKQIVPHTITEWQGSAMCVHKTNGFGMSGTATVKVFQPFFLSVELPYSVVRAESVPVAVSVYNYLAECLVIEVNVKSSQDFMVKGSRNVTMCVCGKDSTTHQYRIIPKTIGNVNITVTARSITGGKVMVCPPGAAVSEMVGVRDAVVKSMLVEPEGAPREYTLSSYVCLRQGTQETTESFSLLLPNDTVADSARAYVSVIGDVMGPSLANLDSLLRMPWGCGEQNMLGFAPNIFVMQYLEATQQANDVIRAKAVEYMKSGYQRQLTYSHADSSYSAFGKQDASGSIWLTAFVVKCFAQARPYIYIDSKNLEASIDYFGKHQLENGCFPEIGKVLHKDMKGGMGEESGDEAPVTLTAYIVIALLEAGVSVQDPVVEQAIGCLDRHTVTDSYSLALLSYAYTLHDSGSARRARVIEQLKQKAIVKDGTMHWERDASARPTVSSALWYLKPVAADVEMTAYAMLALLKQADAVSAVLPIVRWLTQQRNAYGGFASTQDTILAIQALAKFATVTYAGSSLMNVRIEAPAFNRTFETNHENSLILQSAQLLQLPVDRLAFSFSGQGCSLVQANVRYNVKFYGTSGPAFSTTVQASQSPRGGPKACKQQLLEICTQYKGHDGTSNMAIVDVKMVSGWVPDKDSLRLLQSNRLVELKRYEINDKTVSLYFDQISKQQKCFGFDVVQEQVVNEAKPGAVITYDYYDPDLRHETSYSLYPCEPKKDANDADSIVLPITHGTGPGLIKRLQMPLFHDARPSACPTCVEPVNLTSLCSSKHVYKVRLVVSAAKQQLRLMADLRGRDKTPISNVTVNSSVAPGCNCTVLKSAAHGSILIIATDVDLAAKPKSQNVTLGWSTGNSVVFVLRQSAEHALRQQMKRCNHQGVPRAA